MNLGHVQVIAYKGVVSVALYMCLILHESPLTRDGKGERDGALAEELYFILASIPYVTTFSRN
jgi:hypothetical protein